LHAEVAYDAPDVNLVFWTDDDGSVLVRDESGEDVVDTKLQAVIK
jgi:hypothetical protein